LNENGDGGAIRSVYPSGAARATVAAPIFIAPPGIFSTIDGFPQVWPRCSATMRAKVSVVEPGAAGMTIFTERRG